MQLAPVHHRRVTVDGIDTFYREAGPADAPVVLLPHGYPCSSYAYRNLMSALGDRWRLIAPDNPGFGYSATPSPDDFGYTFDAYADFLQSFVATMQLNRYVIWLHDYGSQFGFRLALAEPECVTGLIIQNGDIYEDAFGPKYDFLKQSWNNPGPEARRRIAQHVTLKGFESEFRGELPDDVADRITPDLWTLHWSLMSTPDRVANLVRLLEDQPSTLEWFSKLWHVVVVRAPHDQPVLAQVPLHLLGGGHWLLETHLGEVVPLVADFLSHLGESNS